MQSNAEILELLKQNDTKGLEMAMAKYQKPLNIFAYALTRDWAVTDELVQESFLRLYQKAGSIKDPNKLKSWLWSVLKNMAMDHHRKPVSEQWEDDVQAVTQQEDDHLDLKQAFQGLSKTHQSIVHLHYYEGMKIKEIAQYLGKAEGTIKTHLHRSLKYLMAFMKGEKS